MKFLPLLLVGGGIYLFTKGKPAKKASETITSKIGSKEIGYEIINCNKLVIYNKEKAFQWAFGLGALEAIKMQNNPNYFIQPDVLLYGNCFEQYESDNFKTKEEVEEAKQKGLIQFKKLVNTKEKAKFLFELFQWLYTGLVKTNVLDIEASLHNLTKFKEGLSQYLGYDTADLIVELKM